MLDISYVMYYVKTNFAIELPSDKISPDLPQIVVKLQQSLSPLQIFAPPKGIEINKVQVGHWITL